MEADYLNETDDSDNGDDGGKISDNDAAFNDYVRRLELLSFLGGTRYLLPRLSNRHPYRKSIALQDSTQSIGLLLESESPSLNDSASSRRFFYRARFALLINQGSVYFPRTSNEADPTHFASDRIDSEDPPIMSILPGDELHAGIRFCFRSNLYCDFSIGRNLLHASLDRELTGDHGSRSGLHIKIAEASYGRVLFSPLFLPGVTGTYLPADQDSPALLQYALLRQKNDFQSNARQSHSRGHGLIYSGGLNRLRLGFGWSWIDYDASIYNQGYVPYNPNAHPDSSTDGAGDSNLEHNELLPLYIDRLDYYNLGLGVESTQVDEESRIHERDLYAGFYINLERVSGNVYDHLYSAPRESRQIRVEGHALRTGWRLHYSGWLWRVDFFLPESGTPPQGSAPDKKHRSGYIGYGDSPVRSPILGGALLAHPYPRPCGRTHSCVGLYASDYERDLSIPAAVFTNRMGYQGDMYGFIFDITVFEPLAPRRPDEGGANPFARLRKDPGGTAYHELGAHFLLRFAEDGALHVAYSRLYRRRRAIADRPKRRELAGESLYASLRYTW
ncbi:MAG: hypothetical protein KDK27_07325 [Leptospiraceae bacterium]|nr:hypothetical protein [Leptospiraceae bacterium]